MSIFYIVNKYRKNNNIKKNARQHKLPGIHLHFLIFRLIYNPDFELNSDYVAIR
jgi:hypothetical protein